MPLKSPALACALLTSGLPLSGAVLQTPARVTLPVTVLPTDFGLPDEPAPSYPANVTVDVPPTIRVAAYGAAQHVWLAPPSWTGRGSVGVNGNVSVQLYPLGSRTPAPRITYTVIPACRVCMLSSAAPYFPDALKQFNEQYNADGKNPVAVPPGLTITRLTPNLVTYALPNENDLLVRGAAFYDAKNDGFYEEVRVTLPVTNERVADFLLTYFGDHVGLR